MIADHVQNNRTKDLTRILFARERDAEFASILVLVVLPRGLDSSSEYPQTRPDGEVTDASHVVPELPERHHIITEEHLSQILSEVC